MTKRYRYGKVDFTTPKSRVTGAFYFVISWILGGYVIGKFLFRPDDKRSYADNLEDYTQTRADFHKKLLSSRFEEGENSYKHIKKDFRIGQDPETKKDSEEF